MNKLQSQQLQRLMRQLRISIHYVAKVFVALELKEYIIQLVDVMKITIEW